VFASRTISKQMLAEIESTPVLRITNTAKRKCSQLGIKAGTRYLTALRSEKPSKKKVTWSLCLGLAEAPADPLCESPPALCKKHMPSMKPEYTSPPLPAEDHWRQAVAVPDSLFVELVGGPVSAEGSAIRQTNDRCLSKPGCISS
jgi:hypothetical protein